MWATSTAFFLGFSCRCSAGAWGRRCAPCGTRPHGFLRVVIPCGHHSWRPRSGRRGARRPNRAVPPRDLARQSAPRRAERPRKLLLRRRRRFSPRFSGAAHPDLRLPPSASSLSTLARSSRSSRPPWKPPSRTSLISREEAHHNTNPGLAPFLIIPTRSTPGAGPTPRRTSSQSSGTTFGGPRSSR